MSSVKIYDGKYEFYEDERGMLMCKRNGELWRDFIGDKAVHGLFSRVVELEARLRVIPCLVRDIDKLRDRDEVIAIARGDSPPPTDRQLAMRDLNPDER